MGCLGCGRGFHEECIIEDCEICHPVAKESTPVAEEVDYDEKRASRMKKDFKDRKSTGRKEAAVYYPLPPKSTPAEERPECEWQGKRECGGGKRPVIGCAEGKQYHRHHGPIKDPIRNEIGNVHRICIPCHNHWHELNDLIYDEEEYSKLPHKPEPATEEEIEINARMWSDGSMGKLFELASTKNYEKGLVEDGAEGEPDSEDEVLEE